MTKFLRCFSVFALAALLACGLAFAACGGKSDDGRIDDDVDTDTVTYVTVTFDYNYDGSSAYTVSVETGSRVDRPDTPSRDGYDFYDWYTDADCTAAYDFSSPVTGDITLYAYWLEAGVTYHTVTLHDGVDREDSVLMVKDNSRVGEPTVSSTEEAYFYGWYQDDAYTSKFSFSTRITEDTDIYGKWVEYAVFEAEDLNLDDFSGKGYSGEIYAKGAVLDDRDGSMNASNGAYVSYLYAVYTSSSSNTTLEFHIVSSATVTDAALVMRISAEYANITINGNGDANGELYEVLVNGSSVGYDNITLNGANNDLPFEDYVIGTGLTLYEGENVITLRTANTTKQGTGGTMNATAPMVDCIKIATAGACLTWIDDDNYYDPYV